MRLMHRRIALVLATLAPALAVAAECTWVEPKSKPELTVGDGVASFEWPLDREWFACAKKAGGTMTVSYLLGGKTGSMLPLKEVKRTYPTGRESTWRSEFCAFKPLPHRVQVKVSGTGAFERLAHESEVKSIHCDRCELRTYEGHFAIHVKSRLTPAGYITADGAYDAAFRTCAAEDSDARLELRVYVGRTETEARERPDHTFAIAGIEQAAKFKKAFSHAELCAEGAEWIGIEYFGTGEFAQLNGTGRSAVPTRCGK